MRTPRRWWQDRKATHREAMDADFYMLERCHASCRSRYPGNSYSCEQDCTDAWLGWE